jgi:hypothetical protein
MSTYGIHSITHPKMNTHVLYPLGPISIHELLAPGKHNPEIYQLWESLAYDTWPHPRMNPSTNSLTISIQPPSTTHVDA